MQQVMDQKSNLLDMQLRNLKHEHETRHEKELEYVKNRFASKLKLVKDRIDDENVQLIEESADVDQHVQLFRSEMISNKIEEQKYAV